MTSSKSLGLRSQNHRMFGVGKDLCGSSSPTPLTKQGHLQQAAQDLVQAGLEYLQRRRLHNLPGQPVPVLCHPQSKEVLPHVQTELPMLQFVPFSNPSAPGMNIFHQIRLLTALSSLTLNTTRYKASTTLLGNIFQCLITLIIKYFFLLSNLNIPSLV